MGPAAAAVVDSTRDAGAAGAAGGNSPSRKEAKGSSGEGSDESPMPLDPKETFLTGVVLAGE